MLRARRLRARHALAEARALLEEAVWPWAILSHALLQEGKDLDAAERALRRVLELDPHHAQARRNLDRLLDAFPRIRAAVPGATLKFFSSMKVYQIPESEEQARFGALYERGRATEGVEYVGSVAQPELAARLRSAAVLAYPNTYWQGRLNETNVPARTVAMPGCRKSFLTQGFGRPSCFGGRERRRWRKRFGLDALRFHLGFPTNP